MAWANLQTRAKDFQPAAVGAGETKALFSVPKGVRIWAASVQALIAAAAATDTTVTLGDDTDPDGYIAAFDLEANAAGTLAAGAGAYLAASGGKLYNVADTIDAVYAGATFGATNPKVRFTIVYSRDYPGPGPA